jgi:hypothetical protein
VDSLELTNPNVKAKDVAGPLPDKDLLLHGVSSLLITILAKTLTSMVPANPFLTMTSPP